MTNETKENIRGVAIVTLTGILALAACSIGYLVGKDVTNNGWRDELLKKGYGEYNKKSGEWQLCEPEVVLLNRNTDAIRVLNGGEVTINDYVKIIESDLKDAQKRVEEQAKELIDLDIQVEKYKKSVKIPEKSVKNTDKSSERPIKQLDLSVIVPDTKPINKP